MMTNKNNTPNPARPRVLHVILTLGVGGAEQLVYRMVMNDLKAGRKTITCCLLFVGDLGQKLIDQGGQVYCLHHKGKVNIGIIKQLREIIAKENITVVHAHTYTPLCYSIPAAKMVGGVRVIYTEHGRLHPERYRWKRCLLTPLLALGADHIISISQSTAKAMGQYDRFPANRIKVIHNGICLPDKIPAIDPLAKKRALGLAPSARIIGTAARLEEIKNIPMMLRSFKIIAEQLPDTCLVIAGDGSRKQELESYAKDLDCAERIKFIGMRNDLWEIYQLMEVFLLTSFTEGISVTLLEAMVSGIPPVVTDVGGNSEVVRHGENGYLVALNDDLSMADHVIKLLSGSDAAEKMAKQAAAFVRREFSFDSMIESYHTLYGSKSSSSPHSDEDNQSCS